jgi:dolichyl-phosphate beta-glucosyltransferase
MVRLLSNEKNRGKGFSVRRGVLEAEKEWILFMDADLSTTPEEFEKFLEAMKNHDIVIGSRAAPCAEIKFRQPILRELAGRFFNKIIKLYLGLPFYDTQCGFKCFNKKTKILFERQKLEGWVFDVELLYLANKMGFKVAEVPITWVNDPTSTVKSSDFLKILRDIKRVKRTWKKVS